MLLAATPTLPAPLGTSTRHGRSYPAEIVAAVRALYESGLSYREAAARFGILTGTVGRWARRDGWRRGKAGGAGVLDVIPGRSEAEGKGIQGPTRADWVPFPPAAQPPGTTRREPPPPRSAVADSPSPPGRETRRPRPGPAVHAAARMRVEGSRDGMERIAREFGIGRAALYRWAKRFGWRRPPPPDRPVRPDAGHLGFFRARRFGRPYGGDAVGIARDLVTRSILPIRRIAGQAGVSPSTVLDWIARRGWTRPPPKPRSRREAAERRAAAISAATGGRSRRAYPPEIVAAAGALYRTTEFSTRFIAARVGATRERVAFWARIGGWTRPRDLPDPDGRIRRRRRRRGLSFRGDAEHRARNPRRDLGA